MLFFELFAPAFAVISGIVVIVLFLVDRRARHDPAEPDPRRTIRPVAAPGDGTRAPSGRRPSMSA